jgi:hypothetical protein
MDCRNWRFYSIIIQTAFMRVKFTMQKERNIKLFSLDNDFTGHMMAPWVTERIMKTHLQQLNYSSHQHISISMECFPSWSSWCLGFRAFCNQDRLGVSQDCSQIKWL